MTRSIFYKIELFLVKESVWLFLVLLLFFSYLTQLSITQGGWKIFMTFFLKLCLLFAPALFFALFRNKLQPQIPTGISFLLWIACFLFFPIVLLVIGQSNALGEWFLLPRSVDLLEISITAANQIGINILRTASAAMLATEIAFLFNKQLLNKLESSNLFQRFGLNQLLLFVCMFIAVILGVAGVVEMYEQDQIRSIVGTITYFFSFSIQFFLIILVYYFYFWVNQNLLIPKILKERGVLYYGFAMVGVILILYPLFIAFVRLLPIVEILEIAAFNRGQTFGTDGGGIPFFIMLLTVPIVVSTQWFRQNSQIANLEKAKVDAELNFLRQQINPHFYFNTLNNLYALSLTKDQRTPEVILQLSELMRYVIYRGQEKTVLLKEELKYIEDYIQLQQIRLHKKLNYRLEKEIHDDCLLIPPLLFINLIENAFKHGIEPATTDCFLHLSLASDEQGLIFTCKNSFEAVEKHQDGTGLKNLRRRLELLFPERYELITQMKQNTFEASLKIIGL
ncbi:MAG: sensor histidine kinase [Bacteroidota bacterium]